MAGPMATLVPGIEPRGGLGQHVRGRVTDDVEALRRRGGDDGDLVALGERRGQIDQPIADLGGHGGLGKAGTDVCGDVGAVAPSATVGPTHREEEPSWTLARRSGGPGSIEWAL